MSQGIFNQGQLQEWTEHSTLNFENVKPVEISKNNFEYLAYFFLRLFLIQSKKETKITSIYFQNRKIGENPLWLEETVLGLNLTGTTQS